MLELFSKNQYSINRGRISTIKEELRHSRRAPSIFF